MGGKVGKKNTEFPGDVRQGSGAGTFLSAGIPVYERSTWTLQNPTKHERLLTLPEVLKRTGKGKSSVYAGIAASKFPVPVKDGKSTRFLASEIDAWIAARVAERDCREVA